MFHMCPFCVVYHIILVYCVEVKKKKNNWSKDVLSLTLRMPECLTLTLGQDKAVQYVVYKV